MEILKKYVQNRKGLQKLNTKRVPHAPRPGQIRVLHFKSNQIKFVTTILFSNLFKSKLSHGKFASNFFQIFFIRAEIIKSNQIKLCG